MAALCAGALIVSGQAALATTLPEALARAYATNPQLNAERARQRATDESVPQAKALERPQVSASGTVGAQTAENIGPLSPGRSSTSYPRTATLTATQPVFTGFKSDNSIKQAETSIRAGRETLRNVEQTILQNAASAYMDVLRAEALVELNRSNVVFLTETLRATRDRFNVGEVTRTDVAQAEARLARGQSDLDNAISTLQSARANYRQIIGIEPTRLMPGQPVDRLLPPTLDAAIALGRREHPLILAASFNVDSAQYGVKVAESNLMPTVNLQGSLSRSYDAGGGTSVATVSRQDSASILGVLSIPIYNGGQTYSQVRQAKESLGQQRLLLDLAREQIQASVVTSWGALEAARAQVAASEAEVRSAEIALAGVREEARVGQRTTLDVLNAQQDVVNARSRLVQAQRDRVVASYTVLAAVGRLGPTVLALPVREYKPAVHYEIVRDKWFGLRTPGGE